MFNDDYKNLNDKIVSDEKLLSGIIGNLNDPKKIRHRPLYRPWTIVITVVLLAGVMALIAFLARSVMF